MMNESHYNSDNSTIQFYDELPSPPDGYSDWINISSIGCWVIKYCRKPVPAPTYYLYNYVAFPIACNPAYNVNDDLCFSDTPPMIDSDGDQIPDNFDLNKDDDTPYTAGFSSIIYDSNSGEVVGGEIVDSNGNYYNFGDIPDDLSGFSEQTFSSPDMKSGQDLADDLSYIRDGDITITPSGGNFDINPDGTFDTSNSQNLPFSDQYDNNTTSNNPSSGISTGMQTSQNTSGTETDNQALQKIIGNTDATAKNVNRVGDYLKANNDLLSQISAKLSRQNTTSHGSTSINFDGPSADSIGSAVKTHLENPTHNYTDIDTTNINDFVVEQTLLDGLATKFSNRFTLFTDTVKDSDLFSAPFSLFDGPSSSSAVPDSNFNVGYWGSSSMQSVSIDYSEFNYVWDILSILTFLMTSYACFKIVVVHRA